MYRLLPILRALIYIFVTAVVFVLSTILQSYMNIPELFRPFVHTPASPVVVNLDRQRGDERKSLSILLHRAKVLEKENEEHLENSVKERKLKHSEALNLTIKSQNWTEPLIRCEKGPIFLLIQIHSAPNNYHRRQAIRLSWGRQDNELNTETISQENQKLDLSFKSVFVIGRSRDTKDNILNEEEAMSNKDILLVNITDHYRNLTLKTIEFIRWSSKFCSANYILKTDDDCYVNVPNLFNFLHFHNKELSKIDIYMGRIQWMMPPVRDNSSRYYIPEKEYSENMLPPYAAGGGYLYSGHLNSKLARAVSTKRVISNEDAYVGLLMRSLKVHPLEHTSFIPFIYCSSELWERPVCDYTLPFVIHGINSTKQIWLHYNIQILKSGAQICEHWLGQRTKIQPPLYCHTAYKKETGQQIS